VGAKGYLDQIDTYSENQLMERIAFLHEKEELSTIVFFIKERLTDDEFNACSKRLEATGKYKNGLIIVQGPIDDKKVVSQKILNVAASKICLILDARDPLSSSRTSVFRLL